MHAMPGTGTLTQNVGSSNSEGTTHKKAYSKNRLVYAPSPLPSTSRTASVPIQRQHPLLQEVMGWETSARLQIFHERGTVPRPRARRVRSFRYLARATRCPPRSVA